MWLLLKRGSTPRSFHEARTIEGTTHDTYKEAAVAAGHLDNPLHNEATFAIQEAVENSATPRQLRRLFVLLVKTGYPVAIAFDKYHQHFIEENWRVKHVNNPVAQKYELLCNLQQYLHDECCKPLGDLGIDVPVGFDLSDSDLEPARATQFILHKDADLQTVAEAMNIFTAEQRQIFDTIVAACRDGKQALFDIRQVLRVDDRSRNPTITMFIIVSCMSQAQTCHPFP